MDNLSFPLLASGVLGSCLFPRLPGSTVASYFSGRSVAFVSSWSLRPEDTSDRS